MISLFSYSKDPVKQWGQLQVKGNQLCSQTGDPIVLRGVSYGWHNLWPRFYNKQSVKWLKKDWKCTVLRAAMGTVIEDNYIENPEFALKCMNKVIKAAMLNSSYKCNGIHINNLFKFFVWCEVSKSFTRSII